MMIFVCIEVVCKVHRNLTLSLACLLILLPKKEINLIMRTALAREMERKCNEPRPWNEENWVIFLEHSTPMHKGTHNNILNDISFWEKKIPCRVIIKLKFNLDIARVRIMVDKKDERASSCRMFRKFSFSQHWKTLLLLKHRWWQRMRSDERGAALRAQKNVIKKISRKRKKAHWYSSNSLLFCHSASLESIN